MGKILVKLKDIDLTETSRFDKYTDFKEQFNFEANHRPFLQTYLPPEEKQHQQELKESINNIPHQKLKAKADELIKSQNIQDKHGELLEHMISKSKGDYNHHSSMWSPLLWQANENSDRTKVSIGDKIYEIYDLNYAVAETLQHLYSSEDPAAEYYDWIERQQKIEFEINTAGTTEEEIVARNTFIVFLNDRETDIKRIMSLYAGAAFNPNSRMQESAQEKLKFLTFKISELRRLRQKTEATKDHADTREQLAEEERQRQKEALAVVQGLTAAALAHNAFSLTNKYLDNQNDICFEDRMSQCVLDIQEEASAQNEIQQKIALTREKHKRICQIIHDLRHSLPQKEGYSTEQKSNNITTPQTRMLQGFRCEHFNSLT